MAAAIRAILGPARSGKTRCALAEYRKCLGRGPIGGCLWLAPNWRAATAIRARLLDGATEGCFSPGIATFSQFAETLVHQGPEPVRPISGWLKRQLVRQLIGRFADAGRLEYFAPVARTGGLTDLVAEFIREWKRLEIWPEEFRRACEARGMVQKDRELLAVYEAYQEHLTAHHLYDAEGRFWSARSLLAEGSCRWLGDLSLVVADGFSDFTRTQHEILQLLAQRSQAVWITLPLEAEGRREDLFWKPRRTLAELRRRFAEMTEHWLDGAGAPAWPAMAHVTAQLFRNPRQIEPAAGTAGLEIMEAASQLGEIEAVGRRIKTLLLEGDRDAPEETVRPQDVAVVVRSADELEPLFREVFQRLGVPLAIEGGRRLEQSGALRALATAMQLVVDDWPLGQLRALLGSSYFRPDWAPWSEASRGMVQRAVRALHETRGREAIVGELHRRAELDGQRGNHWQFTLRLLQGLGRALDGLPEAATSGQWVEAWIALAGKLGLRGAIGQSADETAGESNGTSGLESVPAPELLRQAARFDREAWDQFCGAAASADRLAAWMDQPPPRLDRQEATAALVDTLRSLRVREASDSSGRVSVLSAASVRGLEIPYLFVAGLTETSFPRPPRQDALYSEAESQRFIEEGLPLVARQERNREEMLLFYEVITRATRRLVLSYPALDDKGQPLVPSPYLQELDDACGRGRIERTSAAALSPIPPDGPLFSGGDFRVKAVDAALTGDGALLAGLASAPELAGVGANVLAGLRATGQRQRREEFGPWEGIIEGEAARRQLAERFGPKHVIGATALENYAGCPFRFFLDKVCRVEPLEEFALETDFLARGSQMHEALVLLHRRLNAERGVPSSPAELSPEAFEALVDASLDTVFAGESTSRVAKALAQVNRRVIRRWLLDYHRQHASYDGLWEQFDEPPRPLLFEASFGRAAREQPPGESAAHEATSGETGHQAVIGGGDDGVAEPLEFVHGQTCVRVSGRVDRVDLGTVAGQDVFNVIDYKTGGAARLTPETILSGRVLQPALYAIAVAELLLVDRDTVPWRAGYWRVRDRGFDARGALELYNEEEGHVCPDPGWDELRGRLSHTVVALVQSICAGRFPVYNPEDRCTAFCPFRTVCRVGQVRALEKVWVLDEPA